MNVAIDYATAALVLSLVALVLSVPMFWLLAHTRQAAPLLGFIIVMLALGGAIGAYGRVALVESTNPTLDYWIRVAVIATRVAVVGAMLYDIRWLWRHRQKED
ncbi:MAG: hypothetical protein ACOYB2_10570 [Limnohabitans sp.]